MNPDKHISPLHNHSFLLIFLALASIMLADSENKNVSSLLKGRQYLAEWLAADLGKWALRDEGAFSGTGMNYEGLGFVIPEMSDGILRLSINERVPVFEMPEVPDPRAWEERLSNNSETGLYIVKALELEDREGKRKGDGSEWDQLFQLFESRKRFARANLLYLLNSLGIVDEHLYDQNEFNSPTESLVQDEKVIDAYKKLERFVFRSDVMIPVLNIRFKSESAILVIGVLALIIMVSMEFHALQLEGGSGDRAEPWLALDGWKGLPRI
ncbi:MAG: hypothetical protein KC964_31365, partial [Candidatus Omnitrophica bacterium]|nr:hypothetical protein [Candidatus Omnitrophota bacterium]